MRFFRIVLGMTSQPMYPQQSWVPENTFAARLRWMRHDVGRLEELGHPISVDEISERCGLKSATWTTWENGTRPRGLDEIVQAIHRGTNVDINWLIWGQASPPTGDDAPTQGPGSGEGTVSAIPGLLIRPPDLHVVDEDVAA